MASLCAQLQIVDVCNTSNCIPPNTCVNNVCTTPTCVTDPCASGCPDSTTCGLCGNAACEAIFEPGVFTAPATVAVNEEFTLTQVVSNTGTAEGTVTVVFSAGGETQTRTATIPAGGYATLSATFVAGEEGTLDVGGSLNGTPVSTDTVVVTAEGSSSMGMIIAVLGVALLGGFMLMSSSSGTTTPTSDSGGLPSIKLGT